MSIKNGDYYRNGTVTYSGRFIGGKFSLNHYSGGEQVEIVIQDVTNTSVAMKYNATGTFDIAVGIFGMVTT